ncbi:hypothetical protein [Micromonospora sp. RTGN7]|uniref:hypothetical protein n=1 Tax=Micromonospora sp. RTGN7 TaxID=3016526 RepID=UPI0029FEE465|nr:hypothetical protein [Micromonospora sp. RTGN7]
MRDDQTFAERMHRDLRDVRWPEPTEIRAMARRRSRRTAVAAAAAVLAVTSVAAVALGGPATPPVGSWADRWLSPVEPEPPGRAEIPPEALLASADLGAPSNVRLSDTGLAEPVRVDPLLESCAADRGLSAGQPLSRYSRSQTLLDDDVSGQEGQPGVVVLTQDVYRLPTGAAPRLFTELDRVTTGCVGWRNVVPMFLSDDASTTPVSVAHTWQAAARDFAGDQAVLLRQTRSDLVNVATGEPVNRRLSRETRLLVRVGDLVTVIVPATGAGVDGPEGVASPTTDAELRELGRVAARRMCLAANPSC